MSDLRVLYVKIIDVDEEGEEKSDPLYTYLVYDDCRSVYGPSYDTIEEVVQKVNRENVVKFLKKQHPELYERAHREDEEFTFLSDVVPLRRKKRC